MQKPNYARNQNPPSSTPPKNNKPAMEIRIGAIKAAIWENQSEDGVYHQVTFSRIYKAGEEWRRTESFNRDDLLVVAKVADLALEWILNHQNARPHPGSPA